MEETEKQLSNWRGVCRARAHFLPEGDRGKVKEGD